MDDTGTINPAALNASTTTIAPNLLSQPSPRGTKRNRSDDDYAETAGGEGTAGETPVSKRSRPLKLGENTSQMTLVATPHQPVQTPHVKNQPLPQASPTRTSPARSTPGASTKPAVVKALPTVRDHTTDQLGPEGDEYIPRETDADGETKVSKDGSPLDGRKYKCRTFQVPGRGEKLFMLATECARVLGYRDSYLLFNKNRSLYKIIASQQEKDNLIHQEILPYSYRSRQIAIVTARSMFRQFGSRLIEGGRRVRDDYWEAKARKQGFTEEDAAGEKRPGAAKARQAAAESSQTALVSLPQGEVIYSNGPGLEGQPPGIGPLSLAPLPMIHLPGDEPRLGGYGSIIRPRQEISGPPYQDRTLSSTATDILTQATQAAEYNTQLSQSRAHRANYLNHYWERHHEQPAGLTTQDDTTAPTVAPQQLQSPQTSMSHARVQQDAMSHPGSQMIPQTYANYSNAQNALTSPVQSMQRQLPPSQLHQASPSMSMSATGQRSTPSYGYPSSQMWQPAQPQPSPLGQSHSMSYAPQSHQSPMPPPQLPQPAGVGAYGASNPMTNPAYSGMNRSMYQPGPSPQQFGMGPQPNSGQQPNLQGWTAPGSAGTLSQDWPRYQ